MLEQMVETNDEWITTRTGIRERRIIQSETMRELAVKASMLALDSASVYKGASDNEIRLNNNIYVENNLAARNTPCYTGDPCDTDATGFDNIRDDTAGDTDAPICDPSDVNATNRDALLDKIKLLICATVSNETRCPSLACYLQRDLGLPQNILAFDLNAACSGFIYSLICAQRLLNAGEYALIVGAETLSRFVDFTDRGTCILFGDAAGAIVAQKRESSNFAYATMAQGNDDVLYIDKYIHMQGQETFRFAVDTLTLKIKEVCESAGVAVDEIDLFVCHQANERILKASAKRLAVPFERFFLNISKYGNTSAASVPLVLDEAQQFGRLHAGDKVVLAGFGGGLTAGAIYMNW
jgi:3-oxoacyl-[acyl-carrier-protein] synthase-3